MTTCSDHLKKYLTYLLRFKEKLKRSYGHNISKKLYSHGHGLPAVNHCRMRLGLSHLKNHLFNYNILQSKFCENSNCDLISKTSSHFLLFCPRYGPQRHTMLSENSTIIFPGTKYNTVFAVMPEYLCNILLQGSEDLSLNENKKKAFDCVFKFINDCVRFDRNATAVHDESL